MGLRKNKLIDTDNSMVITREKEGWEKVEKDIGRINDDGRGCDLGW